MLVALVGTRLNVARVRGLTRDRQHTGLLVHHGVDLVDGVATNAVQEEYGSRVNRTTARTHYQAIKRGKAHGGIHAVAILDGAQRSTRAQVAAHELVNVTVQELVGSTPDITVAGAVSAILAHVILIHHVTRQSVTPSMLRHVVVESGVGNNHVAQLREELAANLNNVSLSIVVQRCQRSYLAHLSEHLVVNHGRLREVPTTLNNAVTNTLNRLVNYRKNIKDMLNGRLVIGQSYLKLVLLAKLLVTDEGTVDADALAVALGKNLARVGVEQLVLKARATCIDNKNVHVSPI